jgi:predicted aspartyl protease
VARRLFESLDCWSNLDGNRPTVPVTLSTLDGQRVVHEQPMPIDTGFAGAMLLSREAFSYFERAELPESESRIYRTLIGPVPMRTARALLKLPLADETEILVDTPKYGVGKSLIGMRALDGIKLLLSGQRSETCLLKERSQP